MNKTIRVEPTRAQTADTKTSDMTNPQERRAALGELRLVLARFEAQALVAEGRLQRERARVAAAKGMDRYGPKQRADRAAAELAEAKSAAAGVRRRIEELGSTLEPMTLHAFFEQNMDTPSVVAALVDDSVFRDNVARLILRDDPTARARFNNDTARLSAHLRGEGMARCHNLRGRAAKR